MARLAFPENARMGNVHFMTVKGILPDWNTLLRKMEKRSVILLEPVLQDGKNGEDEEGGWAGAAHSF